MSNSHSKTAPLPSIRPPAPQLQHRPSTGCLERVGAPAGPEPVDRDRFERALGPHTRWNASPSALGAAAGSPVRLPVAPVALGAAAAALPRVVQSAAPRPELGYTTQYDHPVAELADQLGVDPQALMAANGWTDPNQVVPAGTAIRVPDTANSRAAIQALTGAPPEPAPSAAEPATSSPQATVAATPSGPLQGTDTLDGHTLPTTTGRASEFWNGAYAYHGIHDTENMSGGAWGDSNDPNGSMPYYCALPVGLDGDPAADWWHNQKILITNPATGKQVVCMVQDKGPAPDTGNAIDLSPRALEDLGGDFNRGLIDGVQISFAPPDAPVGPVN